MSSLFDQLNDPTTEWLLIILLVSLFLFLIIFLPIVIVRSVYENFVLKHSVAYKKLLQINKEYKFRDVEQFDYKYTYDNEHFYHDISPKDYLTYKLVYDQKDVLKAIHDTRFNNELFKEYFYDVSHQCKKGKYDTEKVLRNERLLNKFEDKILAKTILTPTTEFVIKVVLRRTDINGSYKESKYTNFGENTIKEVITKLNQKNGSYYTNQYIWDSICRVERGKVSNRLRFAIYKRDGYRCQLCGRKTNNLEIDHIKPIAKGGKTTYDNLQTLCHRCNVLKGDSYEY